MRLIDLFCGAGGAARGYADAGFEVVGVDKEPQKNYPYEFHQAGAFDFLAEYWREFDAIHASPPCQHYAAVTRWRGSADDHPDLLGPMRALLQFTGKPWVIENVAKAPMRADLMLCGSMFGLKVRRHRWFELSFPFRGGLLHGCQHVGLLPFEHKQERAFADAMGCHWMTSVEAREAIPPAMTEFIGRQLLDHLERAA